MKKSTNPFQPYRAFNKIPLKRRLCKNADQAICCNCYLDKRAVTTDTK